MLQKIIDELGDSEKSLVNPLLKTKILATRINNKVLLKWVNSELNGYKDVEKEYIPSYRMLKVSIICDIYQGLNSELRVPLPILLIKNEELRENIIKYPFLEGVQVLENYKSDDKEKDLIMQFPIEFDAIITREIRNGGQNLTIRNTTTQITQFSITQSLAEIRNMFLTLILSIESEFPNLESVSDKSNSEKEQISKQITIIMQQNNIGNTGDGSTVNTGNDNQINSARGKNISQNTLPKEKTDEVQDFINRVEKILQEEQEFEGKKDVSLEVERIKNQLSKPNPQQNIVNQSLRVIESFMISITANAWTPQILESIKGLLNT